MCVKLAYDADSRGTLTVIPNLAVPERQELVCFSESSWQDAAAEMWCEIASLLRNKSNSLSLPRLVCESSPGSTAR